MVSLASTHHYQPHWDTQNKEPWWLFFLFYEIDKTSHIIILCFQFLAMVAGSLVTDVHSRGRFWINAQRLLFMCCSIFVLFGMGKLVWGKTIPL